MKSRIIFVGIHHKENLLPLDSSTKTGQLIDQIIKNLGSGFTFVKSNLFNSFSIPDSNSLASVHDEWFWTHLPTSDDIVVLLGGDVRKHFKHLDLRLIMLKHPASIWSNIAKANYVVSSSAAIRNLYY